LINDQQGGYIGGRIPPIVYIRLYKSVYTCYIEVI
jgi:hypothetical protein